MLGLVVQATQHALGRLAVVVLHKGFVQASGLREITRIETFKKEAARIAKHFGL